MDAETCISKISTLLIQWFETPWVERSYTQDKTSLGDDLYEILAEYYETPTRRVKTREKPSALAESGLDSSGRIIRHGNTMKPRPRAWVGPWGDQKGTV